MKMTVASAAFCMMSAALADKATAQSASAFNFGGISPSHAAFTLMPAGPEDRIYLNETMLKKEPKRSRLATLPAALGRPASQVRHLIAAAEAGAQG